MADRKISELTNITGANLADGDELVVVDASASETKAITFGEFKNALDTATGFVSITGDTMTGDLALSSADITFGDNDKAIFGAGSDLQIYHDGSYSYIDEVGTNDLVIRGSNNIWIQRADGTETLAKFTTDGACEFRYDNALKLATTSTGVDITGTLTSDGLTVDGDATVNLSSGQSFNVFRSPNYATIKIGEDANNNFELHESGDDFFIRETDTSVTKQRIKLSAGGDISFYEDTGTTAKFFWDASAESLGIGTSSPSTTLDVNTSSGNSQLRISNGTYYGYFGIDSAYAGLDYAAPSGGHRFRVGGSFTEAMRITSSGSVGIGTSSPSHNLHVSSSGGSTLALTAGSTENAQVRFGDSSDDDAGKINYDNSTNHMAFHTNASEAMRIDSSGNVGIGTTSPTNQLHVASTANSSIRISAGTSGNNDAKLVLDGNGSGVCTIDADKHLTFTYSGTERMRIDSSGNLYVGTTDNTIYNDAANEYGFVVEPSGEMQLSADNRPLMYLNRQNGDGNIIDFRKDGTTVGSIGTAGGRVYFADDSTNGITFSNSSAIMWPSNSSGGVVDNTMDIGSSSFRFKDLYLSGGVYLGGTGSANKLDDYEEGTWTPSLQSGQGCFTSVTSISGVSGNYTKIGNQVTAWYKFEVDQSITNAEGILRIDSLPFTSTFINYGIGAAQLYVSHGSNNAEVANAGVGSTTLYIYRGTVNGTTGTPQVQGFVTYQTSS